MEAFFSIKNEVVLQIKKYSLKCVFIYRNIAIYKWMMGATKTESFTESQKAIALLAKAMGHPARVAIIEHLLKVNACICGDLVNELPLAQPTVSQHLKELKSAGIIKGSIEGNTVCYCINEDSIESLSFYFGSMAEKLSSKNSNCC